ncbi:aminodeoxychorismate synthase component I [Caldicellulosiruptor morganii]|uniref:aminodeoxychorismate synthase n=1 Tax=Caldicellulosiruptor morganii TaxID=1387555 RepID=A0ABY7BN63_9FIRM|nr:aminodeoxychorismate synthase component I [Caldicellulosiruptor morganii]WAM34293.1 aminodeoxychorismate synthase component I [Caldicellulosiruptor morganii]
MNVLKVYDDFELFWAFLNLKEDFTVLFESNLYNKDYGRYSFLFLRPKEVFICKDGDDSFEYLKRLSEEISKRSNHSEFIFNGGFAGYFSYNFGVDLSKVERKKDFSGVYKAFFGYYEDFIVFDHLKKEVYIKISSKSDLRDITEVILAQKANLKSIAFKEPAVLSVTSNFEKEEYKNCIKRIKDYIYEGDVYQVNLSQRFTFKGKFDPDYLYSCLRTRNFGAYHAYINLPKASIISTSPELFLRKRGSEIITKPIKGTVKRGANAAEDRILKEKLFYDTKCRSELLMIVDLERNDFAKICKPHTVDVPELFEVESYSSVFHLVSTVKGEINPDVKLYDIIKATFPGGSITGAPKLNAIKIIEELEKDPRGVYTGSIGYISNNFNMEFNIAIRTLVLECDSVYFNVGGGIVWDSDEEEEYRETLYKGRPFFEILGCKEFIEDI